jgi:hypothetical protein
MRLRVVGAGLPRTGTSSLRFALEQLLGGRCCHMSALPGHPFDLGPEWDRALEGKQPNWQRLMAEYSAAVDWPASMFWRELSEANPDAIVLLSVRDGAQSWLESMEATVLTVARMGLAPDWKEGRALVRLMERFAGTSAWDDPAVLVAAHDRHNAAVRATIPRGRLLEWHAGEGWAPICRALDLAVPETEFPWRNRRADWS